MQLQLEIGGWQTTSGAFCAFRCWYECALPFRSEAVYYFYKAPVHLECDQAFYLRKNRALFLGYAQNLKIQGFSQVGFVSFSWFYFFDFQIFNCIVSYSHKIDARNKLSQEAVEYRTWKSPAGSVNIFWICCCQHDKRETAPQLRGEARIRIQRTEIVINHSISCF